ncbi:hypothetical protein MYX82_02730 [Acidobacteria bacterium AH-259-D05]|nr:hypothetical protein [Acidobacteria bacterium AH-259-D05]
MGSATVAALSRPRAVDVDAAGNLFIADAFNNRIRKVDEETGIITTVAGTGKEGFSGDHGPANEATLAVPRGVVVDGAGSLFISDSRNNRIRKVDATSNVITTIVGVGELHFAGDDVPATQASLFPIDVVADPAGNLFIADSDNNRIRKVEATTGIITTVAGLGEEGFSGDGGPATQAALNSPFAVALDVAGNLFIADSDNNRIRKVEATTGIITTVAGLGEEGFSGDGGPATEAALDNPQGIVVDAGGHLFIADSFNRRVRKVSAATGVITIVAGSGEFVFFLDGVPGDGGPATEAALGFPNGLAVDKDGNLFIAVNNRIRKVDAATQIITTVAGSGSGELFGGSFSGANGPATEATLDRPEGVVVDSKGNIFIADRGNQRIRRVDANTGIITTVAGNGLCSFSGDDDLAVHASLCFPFGISLDAAANLFIADALNQRIRAVRGPIGGETILNLTPFRPSEWSDPIVVSNTATHTDSDTLSSTDKLFVDWAAWNNGTRATDKRFLTTLSVDGQEVQSWFADPPLNPAFFISVEDFEVGPLSAGTHTLKLVVDSTSQIAESDESDNTYTKTITITP